MIRKASAIAKLLLPALIAIGAIGGFALWITRDTARLPMRVPGTDRGPDTEGAAGTNPVLNGKTTPGPGNPAQTQGNWPQFRGHARDGINTESVPLARTWTNPIPRELWGIDVGEGYAGAAVQGGRVYLMDYDREKKQDALRCLSFDDGQEIWRFAYPVPVKRNHGMSRTVPTVWSNLVVAIGPKCHVTAVNAETGALLWGMDLVRQFGTTVPPWYAGQCPLIDDGRVILAPGGKESLVVAANALNGELIWKSPNPRAWKMTHSSLMPMQVQGQRMFVYCADKGVAGIAAEDGRILWDTTEWKISIATVPSPVILNDGRIFLSGGYNAGSIMLRVKQDAGKFSTETLFRLPPEVFGATQQTPVLYQDCIYGVRPDGKFVCLAQDGKVLWTSDGKPFGLAPFVIGDGLVYALNDSGLLRIFNAAPDKYEVLAQREILNGREAWGPLALTAGRLIARDLTRLVCLDVRQEVPSFSSAGGTAMRR